MNIQATTILTFLLTLTPLFSEIIEEEVTYQAGSITAKGFLARPKTDRPVPGVLVVHEWWGHNEYARKRARMLAELGVAALAIDMFGDGKNTEHPKDAGTFAQEAKKDRKETKARFTAALDYLKKQPNIKTDSLGAIGYCFGGNIVLQMALDRVEGLNAVASFHGALNLLEPEKKNGKMKAKILVCHGANDVLISEETITKFKGQMKKNGADMNFYSYPGVQHGFTNPAATQLGKKHNLPIAYHAEADKTSWQSLQAFLIKNLLAKK